MIEVEGDIQRYYCRGYKGSVRISLAHQARRSDATPLAAVMIPRTPAAPAKVEKPLRDPAELTPKQQEIRNQYANKVAFEVSYCKNQFNASEVHKHRRLAMEYCLGNYEFTNARVVGDAYEACMRQNDKLISLCSLKMNPGTIEALAPTPATVSPQPAVGATPARPVSQSTNPGPAPAAPQAPPRSSPEEVRTRQQNFAACRQQAAKNLPRGGPDLFRAIADCNRILQQR